MVLIIDYWIFKEETVTLFMLSKIFGESYTMSISNIYTANWQSQAASRLRQARIKIRNRNSLSCILTKFPFLRNKIHDIFLPYAYWYTQSHTLRHAIILQLMFFSVVSAVRIKIRNKNSLSRYLQNSRF